MEVRLYFTDGTKTYTFPYVYALDDPIPGMKATVHEGNRSSGSIIIPGGKESIDITIKGVVTGDDYSAIITAMNSMRTNVTTNVATLSLQHYDGGWVNDWSYTVRRIDKIKWEEDNLRTTYQKYECTFKILVY
jgi:hypothetical protein